MSYNEEVILTPGGLEKLENELSHLRTVKRKEVAERIKKAISFGDITENSEYEDAKNEQAFIEGRIATLEKMLRNARIMEKNNQESSVVSLGSRVKIRDMEYEEDLEYTIVGTAEADPSNYLISNESPVGQAILGKSEGEEVEVKVPAGIIKYKILEVN